MLDSNRQNLRRKLSNRHASSRCAALRPAEPHRLPAAVEELLRFAGSLQAALLPVALRETGEERTVRYGS